MFCASACAPHLVHLGHRGHLVHPRVRYDPRFTMLRAALIGLSASGKSTLFELMTSAKETTRASHGKAEASIGISKVPDPRLDRLTAMFNPRKRVPATVEFSDLAMT